MIPRTCNLPLKKTFFLFGPRQVGKSTLLRQEFRTALRYDLLLPTVLQKLRSKPELLIEEVNARAKNSSHVIIDDVQKIPELLDVIHHILEEIKNPPFFILTGSSSRKLKKLNANLLGGRALTRLLYPLTHIELGESFNLVRALEIGTLPSIYLENERSLAVEILSSYVATYLEEEIRQEGVVRNIGAFSRFLLSALGLQGDLINYSNIARQAMTSDKTIKEYFQILEDTLLGFHLLPYAKSSIKRLSTHAKFYCFDSGVQRAISGQVSTHLKENTREFGECFELWVINEVKRLISYSGSKVLMSFYGVQNGPEIDLVLEFPNKMIWAIEIKSSTSVSYSDVRVGFDSFLEIVSKAKCFCVTTLEKRRVHEDVLFLPWKEFFGELNSALSV